MAKRKREPQHKAVRMGAEVLIHELSGSEVQNLIGPEIYNAIKTRDDHPAFTKIRFAKEGLSTGYAQSPRFPGVWMPIKKWWKKGIIRELVKKLQPKGGVFKKLFDGHSKDDDPTGRNNPSYGDIVWATAKSVAGKLVGEAIAYVQPGFVREALKNRERDIASIEARVGFAEESGRLIVNVIDDVFGIALASSRQDEAGFGSAHVLAVIQELETRAGAVVEEEEEEEEEPGAPAAEPARGNKGRRGRRRMADEPLSVPEVKTWIGTDGISPKQLFSSEELSKDETVKGLNETAVKEAVDKQKGEFDIEKVAIEKRATDAEAAQKTAEDKTKAVEEQLGPYHEEKRKQKLADTIEAAESLKESTKSEVAFIVDRIPANIMEIENDAERGKAIETAIEDGKKYIEEKGLTFKEAPPEEETEEDEAIRVAKEKAEKEGVPPRKAAPPAGNLNPMTGEPYNE